MHAVILIIISRMRKKKQYHTLSLLWITAVGDFQPLPLMQKLLILPSCSYYSFFYNMSILFTETAAISGNKIDFAYYFMHISRSYCGVQLR